MPLIVGILPVIGLCMLATALALLITSIKIRFAVACIIPPVVVYCLYWLPVWMGRDPSEYWSWSVVFYFFWGVPSLIACILLVALTRNRGVQFKQQKAPPA